MEIQSEIDRVVLKLAWETRSFDQNFQNGPGMSAGGRFWVQKYSFRSKTVKLERR